MKQLKTKLNYFYRLLQIYLENYASIFGAQRVTRGRTPLRLKARRLHKRKSHHKNPSDHKSYLNNEKNYKTQKQSESWLSLCTLLQYKLSPNQLFIINSWIFLITDQIFPCPNTLMSVITVQTYSTCTIPPIGGPTMENDPRSIKLKP